MDSKINKIMDLDRSNFELELYRALKSYGYLFPANAEEVKKFDELYGNTPIDTPESFEVSSNMAIPTENFDFEMEFKVAAFAPKDDNSFTGPEEFSNKENEPDKEIESRGDDCKS